MKLTYKAVGQDGKRLQGIIDAKDAREAGLYLRSQGLIPVKIASKQENFASTLAFFNRTKSSDVVFFTRQLASMFSSGLTLMQALAILKEQTESQAMQDIIETLILDIQEGKSFSQAITKFPRVFSSIYVSLIKAAESSGVLDNVLAHIADNLENQQKLTSTIRSAFMYPAIVVSLMIVVLIIMMTFVIPQIFGQFQNLSIELPFTTKVIIATSDILTKFWPVIIGIIALSVFLVKRWRKTPAGRLISDELILKIPIVGKLIKEMILTEVARTFGLLVGAGILVVEALQRCAEVSGNVLYKEAILSASTRIEKGNGVGDSLAASSLFPPILVQMAKIGEQTGTLDQSLLRASEYFEREVEQTIKTLTAALEPAIMVVLGIGVAFLIAGIITPIYSLTTSIK